MVEEMIKLRELLDKNGIPWEDKSSELIYPPEWIDAEDYRIDRTHFEHRGFHWSAINGYGTYGGIDVFEYGNEGLIELMSDAVNEGNPIGFLTADEVMDMVKGE